MPIFVCMRVLRCVCDFGSPLYPPSLQMLVMINRAAVGSSVNSTSPPPSFSSSVTHILTETVRLPQRDHLQNNYASNLFTKTGLNSLEMVQLASLFTLINLDRGRRDISMVFIYSYGHECA